MSIKANEIQTRLPKEPMPRAMIPGGLLDQVLAGYSKPEDLTGPDGLLKELVSAVVSRAVSAEMGHHLGYGEGQRPPEEQTNRRNGHGKKTLRSDHGDMEVKVPRDREGSFEPQLVRKHRRQFNGFDDKILAMYSRGMSEVDGGAFPAACRAACT